MSRVGKLALNKFSHTISFLTLKCHKRNLMLTKVVCENYNTLDALKEKLLDIMGGDAGSLKNPKELVQYIPKKQNELPERSMTDSSGNVLLPLSSDSVLRKEFTLLGNVRIGKIMEVVDILAGYIGYKHMFVPELPPKTPCPLIIVTIKFYKAEIREKIEPNFDTRMTGYVCWVGSSSLEACISVDQNVNGKWEQVMRLLVLMAARNPLNFGPGPVNPLKRETPEEIEIFKKGEERRKQRQHDSDISLLKTKPKEDELNLIHNMFLESMDSKFTFMRKALPPNVKKMEDVKLNNFVLCQPEHVNFHKKIFGGYLIRKALELASTVLEFQGIQNSKLINISDISFYTPVDVGAVLNLHGCIAYTEENYLHFSGYTVGSNTSGSKREIKTSYNLTYKLEKPPPPIYPITYLETMIYLDGRRRLREILKPLLSTLTTNVNNGKI